MTRLLDVLREELQLTGTKEGCGEGECGACAVLVDGALVNSCLVPVAQVEGKEVTTIEGLAQGQLHPVQQAFLEHGGAQCGICTPGMIMAATSAPREEPAPYGGRRALRAGREPLPLHGLHAHLRRGDAGADREGAMRDDAARFELVTPKSLAEALALLDAYPGGYRPLAGGTDVMVLFAAGKLRHARYVNVWNLDELRGVHADARHLTMGALTTYTDVQGLACVDRGEVEMLRQAASETGGVAIQNRGTFGGNIANASPAADSCPPLLAYGAEIELVRAGGARWVSYAGFHTGYKTMNMAKNELIARIRVPRRAEGARRHVHYFRKVGPRKAQAISKVSFAGYAGVEDGKVGEVGIALGGVAPIVVRPRGVEALVSAMPEEQRLRAEWRGEVKLALAREIAPIDDIRSNARYRAKVAANLLVEFLLRVERACDSVRP